MLDSLHFDWKVSIEDGWRIMFEALKNFREKKREVAISMLEEEKRVKIGKMDDESKGCSKGAEKQQTTTRPLDKLESINFMKNDPPGRRKKIIKPE